MVNNGRKHDDTGGGVIVEQSARGALLYVAATVSKSLVFAYIRLMSKRSRNIDNRTGD